MNTLRITSKQFSVLKSHLYDGSGTENVAFLVCGKGSSSSGVSLVGQHVVTIPRDELIVSEQGRVTWKTERLSSILETLNGRGWGLVKFHCHPSGYSKFSALDDKSDRSLASAVPLWAGEDTAFASAILLPDEKIICRIATSDQTFEPVAKVLVIGGNIKNHMALTVTAAAAHEMRTEQVFGSKTLSALKNMTVGVVGCSGTGSLLIQQLLHLNLGRLILVDHERVEHKNLNRIVGAIRQDAEQGSYKTAVAARYASGLGLGTQIQTIELPVQERGAISVLKHCDVLIGCVDSAYARYILNKISTFYVIPLIDVGVGIKADGQGGIEYLSARVDYVLPGQSLMQRKVYSPSELQSDGFAQQNPDEYQKRKEEKYIEGVREEIPAVITPNSFAAGLGVTELLARVHDFRIGQDKAMTSARLDLINNSIQLGFEDGSVSSWENDVGKGDQQPVLGVPSL